MKKLRFRRFYVEACESFIFDKMKMSNRKFRLVFSSHYFSLAILRKRNSEIRFIFDNLLGSLKLGESKHRNFKLN